MFANNMPTTSNHVEAWHRRLKTVIVMDHPSFYSCLHKLRQEQRHTEVALIRVENGFRRQRRRRSMDEHTRRLTTLMSDLQCGRKDIAEFLRGVGHAFGSDRVDQSEHEDMVMDEGAPDEEAADAHVALEEVERNSRAPRRRRRLASVTADRSPAERRRLRDLPVRRATAATASLAATNPSTTVATASSSSPAALRARCPVCLDSEADTVLIPCGHCACVACVNRLMAVPVTRGTNHVCPVCRSVYRDICKLHFAA